MKLRFGESYDLFVIYLVLNLAGYSDENNPEGMYPLRKKIREYFKKSKKINKRLIKQMKELLKEVHHPRIVQAFLLKRGKHRIIKKNYYQKFPEDLKRVEKILPLVKEIEEYANLKQFYKTQYLPYLNDLTKNKKTIQKLAKRKKDLNDFVEIKKNYNISIVINLLSSYWAGFAYFLSKNPFLIVTGPNKGDDVINWYNIVHESLHIILREYFIELKEKLSGKLKKIINSNVLDKNYKHSHVSYQLEECFIRALTSVITGGKLSNNVIKKFPLTELIYKELKGTLVRERVKFNRKILGKVLEVIEREYKDVM